ncbi:MAG: S41 family peptidase [bacterium]|nr:S41 family peptidase [bacterium]
MENKKTSNKNYGLILGIALLVSVSYSFGFQGGLRNAEPKTVYKDNPEIAADFSTFWKAWDTFKQNFVHSKDITDQDMLYGAISGLVNAGNDPYTVFLKPSDANKFEEDLNGNFGGIGAQIDIRNSQLMVVAPLKDSPAERVGLKSGDKILKINSTSTDTLATIEEAVKLIRGTKGTTVVLTILRDGWALPKEISIIRDTIAVPTLDWEMKSDNIAYIQLYSFNENAPLAFYKAALPALISGAKGIILDLRNNPGGYLDAATNIAGWFLKSGDVVVREEFSSGKQDVLKAQGNSALADLPVVVLVNGGSASASEILAGALRDNRHVKIIGETTFGKGTVQELKRFTDGSEMKVSIAQWLLPNGETIDKKGITPDIVVELTEEDATAGKDPQLDKAMEIIKAEIK